MQLTDDTSAESARAPLPHSQLIDMTTIGRHTGRSRRIEIVLHNFDARLYISGMPNPARTRAWLHNLATDPRLTLHLKGSPVADLPATARIIDDEAERRAVFARLVQVWRGQKIEAMTRFSPLIEVTLTD